MFDIIGLGELLVDFTPYGKSAQNNDLFEANPGGSVANFTVAAARLGSRTAFMGKLGDDMFGHQLFEVMRGYGVNTDGVVFTGDYMTTLAFVKLYENGERDFSFYRKLGADAMLDTQDINFKMLEDSKAVHFSSLTLVNETCFRATEKAIAQAKKSGAMITYDPNWRPNLWDDPEYCRFAMGKGMFWADVVKVSEEELRYITGIEDDVQAAENVLARGPRLVIETMGEGGSTFFCTNGSKHVTAYSVKAVDATGAGDACFGAIVHGIIKNNISLDNIDTNKLQSVLKFANATAAISVMGRGGMPSLPTYEQVVEFMNQRG